MAAPSRNAPWLALTQEEALEPELPICDPHHHLWDWRGRAVHPRYMVEEMAADLAGGHAIVSTVFIECSAVFRADGPPSLRCVGEVEFAVGQAALAASGAYGPTRIATGIVGGGDLCLGDDAAPVLDALMAAGGNRFRGIRQGAFWDASDAIPNHRTSPPPGLYRRDDFRAGFRHLGIRGLTFDALCYHPQLGDVLDLARAFPDTTIVLDHVGCPLGAGPYAGRTDEVRADWRAAMETIARCPNVVVKLGGLGMDVNGFGWEHGPAPPDSETLAEALRPWIEPVIEGFGVARCMFESNFPVDKLGGSYTVLWNAFKRLTRGWSGHERAALFHDTAARVYRLG